MPEIASGFFFFFEALPDFFDPFPESFLDGLISYLLSSPASPAPMGGSSLLFTLPHALAGGGRQGSLIAGGAGDEQIDRGDMFAGISGRAP